MKIIDNSFKLVLSTIAKIYIIAISIFFAFRLLLFISNFDRITISAQAIKNILTAFIMGVRFDVVIIGYIVFLPVLVLLIESIVNRKNKIIDIFIFYYLLLFFSTSFIIAAADIPYFNQFFKRFEIGAFEWMDSPVFVFKMIFEEPSYILAIIPLLFSVVIFYKLLKRIFDKYTRIELDTSNQHILYKIGISIFVLSFIFIGIRGRLQKKITH